MSDCIIKIEGLGKKYILRHEQKQPYYALRDVMAETARNVGRKLLSPFRTGPQAASADASLEEFWALQDVSLEINRGDRVGIIGRNGAGKSTLLKILSRITEPTTGRFTARGRLASLLEVGTGFHPELTGRENIFLTGAILGMSTAEIRKKFDEIVDFAEVEKFLDTPVKRYSSGMYVRLAFAVAAHLEPEILIVDEVLAVGDAQFQKKCLGKMEDVSKQEGRTVLFVSHNLNAIEMFCNTAVLLQNGRVERYDTDVRSVTKDYLSIQEKHLEASEWVNTGRTFDNQWFKPTRFFLADRNGNIIRTAVENDSEVWIHLEGDIDELEPALTIGYAIYAEDGQVVYWSYQTDTAQDRWPKLSKGRCSLKSRLPQRLLNEGVYKLELIGGLHFRQWLFQPGIKAPSVYLEIRGGLSDSPYWMIKRPGVIAPIIEWRVNE